MARAYRAGPVSAVGGALLLLVGCGDSTMMGNDGGGKPDLSMAMNGDLSMQGGDMAMGMGGVNAQPATTGGAFRRPFDAVPSPDGTTFYFTALGGMNGAGVFSVPAAGGMAKELFSGPPLVSPFGLAVSSDGKTLYVADAGANQDPSTAKHGDLFSLSSSGGMPSVVAGATGYEPRGLDILAGMSGDTLYFTGVDASNGKTGLFTISPAGGMPTVEAEGYFTDPSGIAVTKAGDAYVADTAGSTGAQGRIWFRPKGMPATEFVTGLPVGYPAGIALSTDEKTLFVSGQDPQTRMSVVYAIDVVSKKVTSFNMGLGSSSDSGGLHRAATTNVFAWAGVTAGNNGQGVVFQVTIK